MELVDLMLNKDAVAVVQSSLREDIGSGDVTTLALVNPGIMATGEILAREPCVVEWQEFPSPVRYSNWLMQSCLPRW